MKELEQAKAELKALRSKYHNLEGRYRELQQDVRFNLEYRQLKKAVQYNNAQYDQMAAKLARLQDEYEEVNNLLWQYQTGKIKILQ